MHRVLIRFIVGNAPCQIPPMDRLDQYCCQPEPELDPGIHVIKLVKLIIIINNILINDFLFILTQFLTCIFSDGPRHRSTQGTQGSCWLAHLPGTPGDGLQGKCCQCITRLKHCIKCNKFTVSTN